MKDPNEKKDNAKMKTLAELSVIGIQFPVSIFIGYFIGAYLDKLFGTKPWLMVLFSIFGVASAFINVFRLNAKLNKMESEAFNEIKDEDNTDD